MNIIKRGCLRVIALSQKQNAFVVNNLHYNQKSKLITPCFVLCSKRKHELFFS